MEKWLRPEVTLKTAPLISCHTALASALPQLADRFGDASLTSLGCLGSFDREHEPLLVAIGQPIEEPLGVRITVERVHEVRRHAHLARLGVEFNVDIHLVTGGDTGSLADLCTDREHELPADRRDAAAISVTVDRDADRWPLARPEALNDLCRNSDTGGGLAAQLDDSTKSHKLLLRLTPIGISSPIPQHQRV